jgi:hypothetical protein
MEIRVLQASKTQERPRTSIDPVGEEGPTEALQAQPQVGNQVSQETLLLPSVW